MVHPMLLQMMIQMFLYVNHLILCAALQRTCSLGSVGWDGKSIYTFFSCDFPTSKLSVAQEKGQAGWHEGSSPETDQYIVCGNLWSYVLLV